MESESSFSFFFFFFGPNQYEILKSYFLACLSRESRDMRNGTTITEFILLGFPDTQGLQIPLFLVIFCIYVLTLAGNGFKISIVWAEPRLQIPMYFFLCTLSFLEIWFPTTVIPKLSETFVLARTAICIPCCLLPLFPGNRRVLYLHCHVF